MKLLITGANGLLGSALRRRADSRRDCALVAIDRDELDITDATAVDRFIDDQRPDWIVNCAAFTLVDDCETHEDLAMRINGDGPGRLARAAAAAGARLVHLSTDYVFDGRATAPIPPDAPTAPPAELSAYGRSKLLGERHVQDAGADSLIVRTAWLYGHDGPCFPRSIVRAALEGRLEQVVNDQRGSPTYADDLADAIFRLIDVDARGIVHVVNDGECTWFDFACEILHLAGIECPIRPCTTAEFPRPARRPAYSVLDLTRYEQLTAHRPRHWRDALVAYFSTTRGLQPRDIA